MRTSIPVVILAVYGSKHGAFLAPNLASLERVYGPEARAIVLWQDLPATEIATLSVAFPFATFKETRFSTGEQIMHAIPRKIYAWLAGAELASLTYPEYPLLFLDADAILIRRVDDIFTGEWDVMFTWKNEMYPINTGVMGARDAGAAAHLFRAMLPRIERMVASREELATAVGSSGAADQHALRELIGFCNYEGTFAREVSVGETHREIVFRGEPCSVMNETRSRPISDSLRVIHYKTGWHPILLEGKGFTVNRPEEACRPMLAFWNELEEHAARRVASAVVHAGARGIVEEFTRIAGGYEERGVLHSEMLAACGVFHALGVDLIIESGRCRGQSTRILAEFFGQRATQVISIELVRDENAKFAESRLGHHKYLELVYGDTTAMLPDILPRINGRRIGLLLDGPKGAEALKLAMNAFSLNAEVAVACIHDMRRDTAQRALAMSSPVRSFFTDESAYRRAYAGLDRGCLPTGEITIHTWRPYKKGHEDIPAYGPTLGVFLPRPSSSRRLPQSTPSTPVAQERGGDAGGSGSRGLVATGGVTVAKPVTVTRPARTISTPNRFLHSADLLHPAMERLQTEFEEVYRDELKGRPHPSHARSPEGVVMHWSRAWEYPWTVMHGDFAPGMRVVDLGCGGSPLIPFLAWRVGCACTGVDLNLVSREGHTLRGFDGPPEKHVPEAEWVQADMTSTGLPAESFDRVLCISVLEHLEEETAAKALGEMRRLLAPGGRVLVTTDVDGAHRTLKVDYRRLVELAAGHGLVLAGARELDAPESPAATREGHRGTYDVVGMVFEEVSEPHRVA